MKVCPKCQKSYADDGLNFCLDDGSILTIAPDKLPETVMMNQPRFTDPDTVSGTPHEIRMSYGDQPAYSLQPKKRSSKAWIWVLGILGAVILLCGGGFGAFFVYVASLDPQGDPKPTPGTTATPTPKQTNTSVESIDLVDWVRDDSSFGNTSYSDGEFFMSSKKKGFYYVVAAPAEFKTENARSSVILRNVSSATSTLGYGIVFHSDPKPLQKGYAFLIDTVRKRYRVVRHDPTKETDVVKWTNSSAIKDASQSNKLEVNDTSDRIELYINGEMVTSIKNTHGFSGGVIGLYSGDAVNVAFKELQIAK